jgi:DNA-binding response OmpR family regulator
VDVTVQRLRAKLDVTPAASRCIQTVRGFGYRCVPVDEGEPGPP